jgi:hypothetical protein
MSGTVDFFEKILWVPHDIMWKLLFIDIKYIKKLMEEGYKNKGVIMNDRCNIKSC